MTTFGVVVAAGEGERFGSSKAEALLAGRPLWQWARDALADGGVDGVVVVGGVPGGIPGGQRRRDSVLAGLRALPGGVEHVLVHDAARPLAGAGLVRSVMSRLVVGDVDGVVPGVPIGDTIKRVDGERVVETVPRVGLVVVQTPQGFVLDTLVAAHEASPDDATDDAELVERAGGTVVVVEGEVTNLKVTYPQDLAHAERLMR
jgi:2-C-methyl-D-erythritol 4-phosphate cytidylyltransferase